MRPVFVAGLLPILICLPAHAQAPASDDFARGRELRQAGRPAEAVASLERAAAAHPDDADIWLNLGLAYSAAHRLTDAETALDRAAHLAPDYPDVQLARARLAYFQDDLDEAARRLSPLLQAHPDNAEARALGAQIEAARVSQPPRWRLDAAYAPGFLSKGLPDAFVADLGLTRNFRDHQAVGVAVEAARQFGRTDVYSELTGANRFGYLALGGTPNAHFRPQWAVRGGLYGSAWRAGDWAVQPALEASWARYLVGDVKRVSVGLDADLHDAWLLSGRLIWVRDERDQDQTGYSLRSQWRVAGPLSLVAGWSDAPESNEGFTVRVKTATAGAAWDLTPRTTLRVTAAHEMRNAYDRDDLVLALTRTF